MKLSSVSMSLRRFGALALLALTLPTAGQAATTDALVQAGQRIYEQGLLPSGEPLQARRADGSLVRGSAAACSNCHRPSGMGQVESDIQVAPITGRFLFPQEGERPLATMDPRVGKRMNLKREPHTDATLAQALRTGVGSNQQVLSPLMPRFELGQGDMQALIAYLRQLSVAPSPGVEDRTLHFATVVTPGVEPARKKALLDMLRAVMMQKNGSTVVGNSGRRHMVSAAELVLGTENKWTLDVWELSGAPETWAEQLRAYYRIAPVFALVSGLGNGSWEPVEQFCETERVPCWFPSVSAPPQRGDEQPRYSFYFSRGVALEAEVMAQYLRDTPRSGQLVQLVRGSDASQRAARTLAAALSQGKPAQLVQTLDLDQWSAQDAPARLAEQLKDLGSRDTLMLWLRPDDLRLLAPVLEKVPALRFASGNLLSATASFVPESLRAGTQLVYPYELPAVRERNVAYMHIWLKLRRIPLVDEALQSEIYFGMNLLTDTLAEMLDNLYRDYLVERTENMIGQRESRKAEDEMREQGLVRPRLKRTPMNASIPQPVPMAATGYAEHTNGLREGTTVYPRLTLGPAQRYASKGAYIVGFEKDDLASARLVALTPWMVP